MNSFLEILKYLIPSVVLFLTVVFMMKYFFSNDEKQRRMELLINTHKIITPIRLQAYERMVLLLERISPESLLIRVKKQGMTCQELQSAMLKQIRAEFEHNLSQQIYMTAQAWDFTVNSKENLVKLINTSALEINPAAPAMELGKVLLEEIAGGKSPVKPGIEYLKKEVAEMF
ncbi:MAG: hypothetical protein NTW49_04410 [Bacteroidia bacterium]|nr:hypothetical protein [Bacteroidia bacterium]